jgi:hypothetical protein
MIFCCCLFASKDTQETSATLDAQQNDDCNDFSVPEPNAKRASTTKMLPPLDPARDLGRNSQVRPHQTAHRPNNAIRHFLGLT